MNTQATVDLGVRQRCSECEKPIRKAHKIHNGAPLCQSCYQRLFKNRQCLQCGAIARALDDDPSPMCSGCRTSGRICLRCERQITRAALVFKGSPVCASCAHYFRDKKPCPRCGNPSSKLSRIVGVTDAGVCDACRRQLLNATCSVCGKHRQRYALSPSGQPLCKVCAENPDASHRCPDCGIELGGAAITPCLPCAASRALRRKGNAIAAALMRLDTKRLVTDFVDWSIKRKSVTNARTTLPTVVGVLVDIEKAMKDEEMLTPDVFSNFPADTLRRCGTFTMYLAENGLLDDSTKNRSNRSDTRRLAAMLEEVREKPWKKAIEQYAALLASPERKLSLRTQRAYLRAAVELMHHANVDFSSKLEDVHVAAFLKSKPGYRASLFPWLEFIRNATERKPAIPKRRSVKRPTIAHVAKEVAHLWESIEIAPSKPARRALVAKFIALIYGVPFERVLGLEVDDVVFGVNPRICLEGDWVSLEQPVAQLLSDLVADVTALPRRRKLFPGRLENDGLSVATAHYHLKRYDVAS